MTTITVKVADNDKTKLAQFIADIGGEILSETNSSEKRGNLAKYKGTLSASRSEKLKKHTDQVREEWNRSI